MCSFGFDWKNRSELIPAKQTLDSWLPPHFEVEVLLACAPSEAGKNGNYCYCFAARQISSHQACLKTICANLFTCKLTSSLDKMEYEQKECTLLGS
jgi:hypothetical protein